MLEIAYKFNEMGLRIYKGGKRSFDFENFYMNQKTIRYIYSLGCVAVDNKFNILSEWDVVQKCR